MSSSDADRDRNRAVFKRKEFVQAQETKEACQSPKDEWLAQERQKRRQRCRKFFKRHSYLVEAGFAPRRINRLLRRGLEQ